MSLKIIPASERDIERAGVSATMPVLGYLGLDGDEVVAAGGLAWGAGRCWLWFSMFRRDARYAVPIVRHVQKLMRRAMQLGAAEIYTPRDDEPTSKRLLEFLGFAPFGEEQGYEVWRWQSLQ